MPPKAAQSPEDLLPRDAFMALSGLEYMQAMLRGEIAGPAISATLNYRVDLVEPGRVTFRGTPLFAHTNPMGAVHGGWYGTLLDSCMACAVMTAVPKGSYYTTLEYRINITRAIPVGTEIVAEGVLQHSGRSTGVSRGEIRGHDGTLYATGSTTCLIMSAG